MSLLQEYYQTTEREVKAPSGIVYKVRGLSITEYGESLKGLPALSPSKDPDKPSENSIEDMMRMQRDVCRAGTVSLAWGNTVAAGDERPDPAEWPATDLASVFLAIQEASGLVGQVADSARRSV